MSRLLSAPLRHEISETILGYMAGLIDGDGTISLSFRDGSRSPTYQVLVTGCNRRLIEWVQAQIGGAMWSKANSRWTMGTEPQYQWGLKQPESLEFIGMILPYLVGKRRQGELLLEAGRGLGAGYNPMPETTRREIKSLAAQVSYENRQAWKQQPTQAPLDFTGEEREQLRLIS